MTAIVIARVVTCAATPKIRVITIIVFTGAAPAKTSMMSASIILIALIMIIVRVRYNQADIAIYQPFNRRITWLNIGDNGKSLIGARYLK